MKQIDNASMKKKNIMQNISFFNLHWEKLAKFIMTISETKNVFKKTDKRLSLPRKKTRKNKMNTPAKSSASNLTATENSGDLSSSLGRSHLGSSEKSFMAHLSARMFRTWRTMDCA